MNCYSCSWSLVCCLDPSKWQGKALINVYATNTWYSVSITTVTIFLQLIKHGYILLTWWHNIVLGQQRLSVGEGLCSTCWFREPIYLWLCQFQQEAFQDCPGCSPQLAGWGKSMEEHTQEDFKGQAREWPASLLFTSCWLEFHSTSIPNFKEFWEMQPTCMFRRKWVWWGV